MIDPDDYGQLYFKPSTAEVWLCGGDGGVTGRKGEEVDPVSILDVPGVSEVHYEAESDPEENDGWIFLGSIGHL